ncbi:MAG: hypothetical protein GY953_29795 [bacterium]|nr:hypothetical protein [bacterium]
MHAKSVAVLLKLLGQSGTVRDPPTAARLPGLIRELAARRFPNAAALIRFHEALLILRAYPHSAAVWQASEPVFERFAELVGQVEDTEPFEEAEVSGIAGTGLSAVFSFHTARRLASRHPDIDIDWDYYESAHHMGRALPRFLPLLEEDSLVEATVPYREWLRAATPKGKRNIEWLMERFSQSTAEVYDSLELMLRWRLGSSAVTRSRMRLSRSRPFYHRGPLLRRSDVCLADELAGPPLPVTKLSRAEGQVVLDLALDTSAVRYRELHGFSFGDPAQVWHAPAGRGLDIYLMGVLKGHRLPLRAYHGAVFVKNGVPVGYFEGLSLFERMEVGFNLYYTFREGESAWLFARMLRLLHQLLGVTCFAMDPYQIGHENTEAIASGAFWFYRKLGFRPVREEQAALVLTEEKKLASRAGYRTPARTLRRLAASPMVYEMPGSAIGDWDRFQVRSLGLAVQRLMAEGYGGDPERLRRAASTPLSMILRLAPDLDEWSAAEKKAVAAIIRAKHGATETLYLMRMQKHPKLRRLFLEAGVRRQTK